jgi:hypothetical protein
MSVPYKVEDLDALIRACIEFTDQDGSYFTTGNIVGRTGVDSDLDLVRRMMDWVSETDKGILEYSGIGMDGVPYFRIGRDAKRILGRGGFRNYLSRRHLIEVLDQMRIWAPICISLLALVVSALAWRAPQGGKGADEVNRRIDEVNKRVDEVLTQVGPLRTAQEQLGSRVATMQSNLDARRSSRGPAPARRE